MGVKKCQKWCPNSFLNWGRPHLHGDCVRLSCCDSFKIDILKKGRFLVSFSLNVKGICERKQEFAVHLQDSNRKTLYTVYGHTPPNDTLFTISMGGVLVDTIEQNLPYSIFLRLESSDPLMVEQATLNIVEV